MFLLLGIKNLVQLLESYLNQPGVHPAQKNVGHVQLRYKQYRGPSPTRYLEVAFCATKSYLDEALYQGSAKKNFAF